MLFASLLWTTHPVGAGLIAAGVVVHAYGVVCMAFAGFTLGGIGEIDYASPIVQIQGRMARLRRRHILSGMVAELPWWFLWEPVLVVLSGLGGADLFARAPALVCGGMGVGLSGLIGTSWFHPSSRSAARPSWPWRWTMPSPVAACGARRCNSMNSRVSSESYHAHSIRCRNSQRRRDG